MSDAHSDFLRTLQDRGFIHQCTDLEGLNSLMAGKEPVVAYIGFDCTAPSLHVGNLTQIMTLRHLQKAGHKPIVLMGGGTTRIGDPSGKDEARQLLSAEDIDANMSGIRDVFAKFLEFGDGPTDAVMVDNWDWLKGLEYISFLREYGRHFSVNRMLSFDSVKLRLEREQPLSFLEFNYMILQAYDFVQLYREYGCRLQLGGSDQWGNIVNGVELARRTDGVELFGLTTPLITTASGAKMGKTAQGAVWLNADQVRPYDYWQFWRNAEDGDVIRFMKLFTEIPLEEIERFSELEGQELNEAKIVLATEATALAHGRSAAEDAEKTARETFSGKGLSENLPTVSISAVELENGIRVVNLLRQAGLAASNGEAKRLVKGGGARVNDDPVSDENATIDVSFLNEDGVIKLSAGKKRHALVKPE